MAAIKCNIRNTSTERLTSEKYQCCSGKLSFQPVALMADLDLNINSWWAANQLFARSIRTYWFLTIFWFLVLVGAKIKMCIRNSQHNSCHQLFMQSSNDWITLQNIIIKLFILFSNLKYWSLMSNTCFLCIFIKCQRSAVYIGVETFISL